MPARLDADTEKVTMRLYARDMAILRAANPGNRVNGIVRDLVHLYVARLEAKGMVNSAQIAAMGADPGQPNADAAWFAGVDAQD